MRRLPFQKVIAFLVVLMIAAAAGCQAAAPSAEPASPPSQPSLSPTQPSLRTATPQGAGQTESPGIDERQVELEWPASMPLGESDVIRLSLMPNQQGYTVSAEFPDHQVDSRQVVIPQEAGEALVAVARLDGAGFELSPAEAQERRLTRGMPISWRWSIVPRSSGRHRLALSLSIRSESSPTETLVFSRGLQVDVTSFLGLPVHLASWLVLGIGAAAAAGVGLAVQRRGSTGRFLRGRPNPNLAIEPLPGSPLSSADQGLMRALFSRYDRLVVLGEFRSGYSGSRTWLVLPVHADGRSDAQTIVKIGRPDPILSEFENYERFVKDTLPPITARIQQPPTRLRNENKAALRYTFIGQSGQAPTSLRQVLLEYPQPSYVAHLFETFGPGWWLQRRPYTFRLGDVYDRCLPAHLVVRPGPVSGEALILDGRKPSGNLDYRVGDAITLRRFPHVEPRADGGSLSLESEPHHGQPPLRVRWLGLSGRSGTIEATRQSLLAEWVSGLDRMGLPDPLERLPGWLNETVSGTQSIIHGDLNLENVLIGPGGLVWLIDFASTRMGHPLADFAHLEAEIIAQVIAPQCESPEQYLRKLRGGSFALLAEVEACARRLLFDPACPREFDLALAVTCLGMLKYTNLDTRARHLLYLTAAYTAQRL